MGKSKRKPRTSTRDSEPFIHFVPTSDEDTLTNTHAATTLSPVELERTIEGTSVIHQRRLTIERETRDAMTVALERAARRRRASFPGYETPLDSPSTPETSKSTTPTVSWGEPTPDRLASRQVDDALDHVDRVDTEETPRLVVPRVEPAATAARLDEAASAAARRDTTPTAVLPTHAHRYQLRGATHTAPAAKAAPIELRPPAPDAEALGEAEPPPPRSVADETTSGWGHRAVEPVATLPLDAATARGQPCPCSVM